MVLANRLSHPHGTGCLVNPQRQCMIENALHKESRRALGEQLSQAEAGLLPPSKR